MNVAHTIRDAVIEELAVDRMAALINRVEELEAELAPKRRKRP